MSETSKSTPTLPAFIVTSSLKKSLFSVAEGWKRWGGDITTPIEKVGLDPEAAGLTEYFERMVRRGEYTLVVPLEFCHE